MSVESCKTCAAPYEERERIEALGLRALNGEISWRAAQRELGWPNHGPLKNHMTEHYGHVAEYVTDDDDELAIEVADAVDGLLAAMRLAPAEVKPLYAAAIVNLRELHKTKPSQAHLIQSLKTIQEVTGMKQEQRMLLAFASAMFREVPTEDQRRALPPSAEELISTFDLFDSESDE